MRHNLTDCIPGIERGLERLGRDTGEVVTRYAADELFALPREHRPSDDFDPPLVSSPMHVDEASRLGRAFGEGHIAPDPGRVGETEGGAERDENGAPCGHERQGKTGDGHHSYGHADVDKDVEGEHRCDPYDGEVRESTSGVERNHQEPEQQQPK